MNEVICSNCGDSIFRGASSISRVMPPFCLKQKCRKAYGRLRETRRTDKNREERNEYESPFKTPEPYAPVEFNALGEAVNPDIFQKLVDGNGRTCDDCRWNDNCKARVNLGLWICCESPAKHERELVENSPELLYNLTKLSTVVTG